MPEKNVNVKGDDKREERSVSDLNLGRSNGPSQSLSPYEYDALIFDLDGVVTSTAKLHFDGWKNTFDQLIVSLRESELLPETAPQEFTEKLYLDYVDGKPRYDGVRSFIDSLGGQENWLAEMITAKIKDGSVADVSTSPFVQLTIAGLGSDVVSLPDTVTREGLNAMLDKRKDSDAQLSELYDQCAKTPEYFNMLLEELADRPVELGIMIERKVGDIKDTWVNTRLDDPEIDIVVFDKTVEMILKAKEQGVRVAIASSSKNAKKVLKKARLIQEGQPEGRLMDLFEDRLIIDGIVREEMGLNGKPAPDIFVEAAKRMGIPVHKSIVFEDASSGVAAGKQGNFGLVLGLARSNNEYELKENGADIVVADIGDMEDPLAEMNAWYQNLDQANSNLTYIGTPMERDPDADTDVLKAQFRAEQSLQSVGNGFFCTRGADYEERPDSKSWGYPGTYFSAIRNTRKSVVDGQPIYNEDLVNCINWLPVTFQIDGGEWFNPHESELLSYEKNLDYKDGSFTRTLVFRNEQGEETQVESRHCVSMAKKNLAAIEYSITPLNYSGKITVKSGLDADHINGGVDRYAKLNQDHLKRIAEGGNPNGSSFLRVQTNPSGASGKTLAPQEITATARVFAELNGVPLKSEFEIKKADRRVDTSFSHKVKEGQQLTVHKIVGLHTVHDSIGKLGTLDKAHKTIANIRSFKEVLDGSTEAWEKIWDRAGVQIDGDRLSQQALNLATYHLFIMGSEHNDGGIGPRALTGETYRGHEFWDDILYYPTISLQNPIETRQLLEHRYNGLEAARAYAEEYGFEGAMYPWQAGIKGDEQTQVTRFNPVSGEWDPDNSCRQRHVSLAIAYNVLDFLETTGDVQFSGMGAEMVLDVCRFFSSMCEYDEQTERYSIEGVMGPNEFHEGKSKKGVTDNAYTNLMLAWTLEKAEKLVEEVQSSRPEELEEAYRNMGVTAEEMEDEYMLWHDIREKLTLHINSDGIIANHSEWFHLEGPDEVKGRMVNLKGEEKDLSSVIYEPGRSDRRLRAAGLNPDDYQIQKQADTMMAYYNLGPDEVKRVARMMGYNLPEDHLQKNLDHHFPRTSHGSTLSFITHAMVLAHAGKTEESWNLYRQALVSDLADLQGGTTAEGIHLGVMGGCLKGVVTNFAGVDWRNERLSVNPDLPEDWDSLKFSILVRGDRYFFDIDRDQLKFKVVQEDSTKPEEDDIVVIIQGNPEYVAYDQDLVFELKTIN